VGCDAVNCDECDSNGECTACSWAYATDENGDCTVEIDPNDYPIYYLEDNLGGESTSGSGEPEDSEEPID